jgi:hypothetical protein
MMHTSLFFYFCVCVCARACEKGSRHTEEMPGVQEAESVRCVHRCKLYV